MAERPQIGRVLARLALSFAFLAALGVPATTFAVRGPDAPEAWTLLAASLAVITSIISAWSSRRVVEIQEDAQRPNVYPAFDFTSRYGLVLLRVKNVGRTPAHDISLEWDVELKNHAGATIGFPKNDGLPAITVLWPGESITQIVDTPHDVLGAHPEKEYTGFVTFEDPSRRRYRRPFRLDIRPYSGAPMYDEEVPRTHYELQQIPKELQAIRKAVEKLPPRSNGRHL